jgi:hypothetical protein
MNSCLVKFEDGYAMVTSRNALKLATGDLFQLAAVPRASKNFSEGKGCLALAVEPAESPTPRLLALPFFLLFHRLQAR